MSDKDRLIKHPLTILAGESLSDDFYSEVSYSSFSQEPESEGAYLQWKERSLLEGLKGENVSCPLSSGPSRASCTLQAYSRSVSWSARR